MFLQTSLMYFLHIHCFYRPEITHALGLFILVGEQCSPLAEDILALVPCFKHYRRNKITFVGILGWEKWPQVQVRTCPALAVCIIICKFTNFDQQELEAEVCRAPDPSVCLRLHALLCTQRWALQEMEFRTLLWYTVSVNNIPLLNMWTSDRTCDRPSCFQIFWKLVFETKQQDESITVICSTGNTGARVLNCSESSDLGCSVSP